METLDSMYIKIAQATEEAIRILIQAQQECEELYLSKKNEGDR